ncbi:hypothetical protein A3B42_00555 [Candidatus Daviesbacteria bacterium RIFCSPLOWO2_01_FULL_38_10]|uniref:Metal-dependent phosphohydrolase HD sub domain-containing protein n=1 Tax=Candidatus Daviesbacteria bacterium GW2011_GWF2_38_6 TaxID=1618432 RepID=A0A0G0NMU5_9BACT|nr:MAG: Metal-dependent phosphohydrolase HD sub domain-containing protein [Candidatus Daviesbacteria bacterium GW2011_GWA2_38_17]KKQ78421.1 MAG: Metal-dependent phosphohydrolase HD sub domain-containing protein [Candidatus Daviesbacteria bacterium GW2011_GWF2_38_6]OGE27183.1 MAG: hypothetical protein A3D02_00835 [Candidatus Daviesbacteria bacterium RIFCSPHIGHO2_02_FULL_39_41]OGE40206.1 MAG: hypothetical protein A3B42_00555 [Candidatus Daviesbacteria bacterium RIFCSPLOWO2_01_FULL_38_10]OGE45236.
MKLKDFHHYKGDELTPFEKVERKVMEMVASSKIADSQREDSIIFELMHAAGCMQIGRLLAQKRNLNIDIASVACMLHDIFVIVSGTYQNHGPAGAPIARKIFEEIGSFSENEIETITQAVAHHSEKEIYSDNPYIELVKDVDVFDCSLYKNSEGFYRIHKSAEIVKEYENRIRKVRLELNLSPEPVFRK